MNIERDVIKFMQSELTHTEGVDVGPIDGIPGRRTMAGVKKWLDWCVEGNDWVDWSDECKMVLIIQAMAKYHGIDPGELDGRWGPMTEQAYEELYRLSKGLDKEDDRADEEVRGVVTHYDDACMAWPSQDEKSLNEFFGPKGENIVSVHPPYQHYLAWATDVRVATIKLNAKVTESVQQVWQQVVDAYGRKAIHDLGLDLFAGSNAMRKKKGGSTWSLHSWAIAIDYDSAHNRLRWGKDRARFAKPEYDEWWQIWEDEGWTSLGRQRNFDWMHIQAARLK